MDLARYCVNAVLVEGRSMRAVAAATGRSKSWVHRHVALYRAGGDEALDPRKRGPKVPANLTSCEVEDEIVAWRKRLAEDGLDAGARTIAWHLNHRGAEVPALSTIHRVLRRRGFVTPQPQKRPRSSWIRFESDLPNETWQSDMTHWQLEDDNRSRSSISSMTTRVRRSRAWRCPSPRPPRWCGFLRNCGSLRPAGLSALRQRRHLYDGLSGQPQRDGDRARHLGHHLQARQALPSGGFKGCEQVTQRASLMVS